MDGDGAVGFKEFAIAKRFDTDGDGVLTQEERQNLIEKLKQGYEQQVYWDPGNSGTDGGYRVVQKDGKVYTDNGVFGDVPDQNPKMSYTVLKAIRKSKDKHLEKKEIYEHIVVFRVI